jgi:hypothetical protein
MNLHNIELFRKIQKVSTVNKKTHTVDFLFVLFFREQYRIYLPHPSLGKENYASTMSNWTYSCSHAIFQTARIMNLNCTFEAKGKRDAVISQLDKYGNVEILLAIEWENNYKDIFGPGKELEKLWKTSTNEKRPNAMLLTYVPSEELGSYAQEVIKYWQSNSESKFPAKLYLIMIELSKKTGVNLTKSIHTVEIEGSECFYWEELVM